MTVDSILYHLVNIEQCEEGLEEGLMSIIYIGPHTCLLACLLALYSRRPIFQLRQHRYTAAFCSNNIASTMNDIPYNTPFGEDDSAYSKGGGGLAAQDFATSQDRFVDEGNIDRRKNKKSMKPSRPDESGMINKKSKNQLSSTTGHDSSGVLDSQPNSTGLAVSDSRWFDEGATGLDLLRSPPQRQQNRLAVPEAISLSLTSSPRKPRAKLFSKALPLANDLRDEVLARKVHVAASRQPAAHHENLFDLEAFVQNQRAPSSAVDDVRASEGGELNFSGLDSPSMRRSAGRQRYVPEAPAAEAGIQSMLDDFASFAEPSLAGQSRDDTTSVISQQSLDSVLSQKSQESLTAPEAETRDILVTYLVSMGTSKHLAEDLAFGFMAEENIHEQRSQPVPQIGRNIHQQRSQSVREIGRNIHPQRSQSVREIGRNIHPQRSQSVHQIGRNIHPQRSQSVRQIGHTHRHSRSPKRTVARSIIISKLNCNEGVDATAAPSKRLARSKSQSKLRSIQRGGNPFPEPPPSTKPSYNSSATSSSSSLPRIYVRAEKPGVMQIEGRAFGAPVLPQAHAPQQERDIEQNGNVSRHSTDHSTSSCDDVLIEAQVVNDEVPIFYADKVTLKNVFQAGPMRKFAIIALLILAAAIAVICSLLLTRPGPSPEEDDRTLAPSAAPTFIISDEILTAAATLSGWVTMAIPESPQSQAVMWMSTLDEVDPGEYGEAFVQRYVMTVFYLSTTGEDYLDQESWLNPELHECDWSSGISCVTDITNRLVVVGLDLTRNGVSGTIPIEFGLLSDMNIIRLPKNRITGSIPQSLFDMNNLQTLDLGSNLIIGQLRLNLVNATELSLLILSDNDLSGLLPVSLWNLKSIRTLNLSSNRLGGKLPEKLTDMKLLVTLDLRNNMIEGSYPDFSALQKLDFVLLE